MHLHQHADRDPATLTIVKDTQPDGPQDFAFTTTGAGLSPFSLDDDTDPTLPNAIRSPVSPPVPSP